MSSLSDLLLDFFLLSTDLVEAEPNPRKSLISTNNEVVKSMVKEDSYIPLFSVDKMKFIKNLSTTYPKLKEKASDILSELGVKVELPASYKVAITMQLSIIETWRRIIVEKLAFTKRVIVIKDKLDLSPYTLLLLYRFVMLSKFSTTGKEMIEIFKNQLEDPRNRDVMRDAYEEAKKIIDYSTSDEVKKNKGEQRRAYTMYNTLYAPLVMSYALNGANLVRFYQNMRRSDKDKNRKGGHLPYTATALMDVLGTYSFRIVYGYARPTLESMANELVQYFSVAYEILSSDDFKSVLKEGSLYSSLVNTASKRGINDMSKISQIWDIVNNAVVAALVTLGLCEGEECEDHADVLELYREKVGNMSLYEYTTRQYGLAY